MAVYAVGDVQGCYDALQRLLESLCFDPARDELWFAGDLVNRGPGSLKVLEFVMDLGGAARIVLGNHDLHLLAVFSGNRPLKKTDTFDDVLKSERCDELLYWLRRQPLFFFDPRLDVGMAHAGILPHWNFRQAQEHAEEVGVLLRNDDQYLSVLRNMYGNSPDLWRDDLSGMARIRLLINIFTRLRYCDRDGRMDFELVTAPGSQPPGWFPWYEHRVAADELIVFGHWSTLGAGRHNGAISLDSGCVWGGRLSAVRLDPQPGEFVQVACA